MHKSNGFTLALVLLTVAVAGCQSGPRWDWWRVGSNSPTDSSPIARSAGPPLPSELAQQSEMVSGSGDPQMPIVDQGSTQLAGSQPGAMAQSQSPYSAPTGGYDGGYPATPAQSVDDSLATYPSNIPSGAIAAGANTAPNAQPGMYDPQAYAPSVAPGNIAASPGGGRYAMASGQMPATASSAMPSGSALSSHTAQTYANTNSIAAGGAGVTQPPAGSSVGATSVGATPLSSGHRYASTSGADAYSKHSAPTTHPAGQFDGGVVAAGHATAEPHYRPGGTSDYPGASASVSVATRNQTEPVPANNYPSTSAPSAPPFAPAGSGGRY